ncbi:MAG: hypothetical protein ABSD71_03135 [Bacteroidales bacterium]|jgi:hypothetical protein
MHKKRKKIIFISALLIIILAAAFLSLRYLPLHKFLKLSGTSETVFLNNQQYNSEAPHTLYFNFEVDPKSGNTSKFYKGIAHSGNYSTKTFGKNSYSFAVERKAGEIGLDNLGAIAISAWVYVFPGNNEPLGNFVFAASNGNINIAWKAVTVSGDHVPRGKWFKISGLFDLSDIKFKPDYKLEFYFWNNSNTDILEDDFYIVFGGPKPRRGDSTLVNLANGGQFTPRLNFPPYPFHLFDKVDIHNVNSSFLINNGKVRDGDISPYDRIISGHFISNSTEDLLVINKSGRAELYTFCKGKNEFSKIMPQISTGLSPFFQSAEIITGCFTGGGTSQILLSGPNGVLLGEFEKQGSPGSGKIAPVSFKTLLNTTSNPFSQPEQLIAADLDGNKITEILAVDETGSWKVYRFEKGNKDPWLIMASGLSDEIKQWNSRNNNFNITAGHFLQRYPQDLLLSISGGKTKTNYTWSILRFDPVSRSFISCYSEKQNYLGKTIGLDTLKPTDKFLTGSFDNSGKIKIFRYNRDWRFDLKEIRFNDTTFQVIANMDFSGYEKDFNPKYYEILSLYPARIIDPTLTSLLVIGKNCNTRDSQDKKCKEFIDNPTLPATIGVYSLQKTEK